MIQLFILPSHAKNAGRYKTIGSFPTDCIVKAQTANTFIDVNRSPKEAPWFGIFFDNEYIDADVKKNLKTFLMTIGNDALVLYKKNYLKNTADFCPRIFRSSVELTDNFAPKWDIKFEKILNGWICEHGFS